MIWRTIEFYQKTCSIKTKEAHLVQQIEKRYDQIHVCYTHLLYLATENTHTNLCVKYSTYNTETKEEIRKQQQKKKINETHKLPIEGGQNGYLNNCD